MKKILALPILITSLMASFTSNAQCTVNPTLQADSKFPLALQGRLVYHSYVQYGDGSSNLFLKDFRFNTLTQINQPFWNIEDPMNAHFSPNGRYLTFMGKQNSRWNIFIWKTDSQFAPINLSHHTDSSGGTSEDPKFSADGNYIVYKNNGDVALMHMNYNDAANPFVNNLWRLTQDGYLSEESMPYLSSDGKSVFYSRGARENSDLYRIDFTIQSGQLFVENPRLMAGRSGLAEYYPIVQNKSLYFVGWKNATARRDQVYSMSTDVYSQPSELNLNDCNADNSDPMSVDAANLFFSSTRGSNFYNLFMGNISTGKVWSLNKFGVNQMQKNQLGATYSALR
ncbi:TolB family protein [Crenothrix sp.]|uniref:TolB family protein n=1 Tax=Crenothrix sp. TaxID=3100433 RepID=UPI00374DD045